MKNFFNDFLQKDKKNRILQASRRGNKLNSLTLDLCKNMLMHVWMWNKMEINIVAFIYKHVQTFWYRSGLNIVLLVCVYEAYFDETEVFHLTPFSLHFQKLL